MPQLQPLPEKPRVAHTYVDNSTAGASEPLDWPPRTQAGGGGAGAGSLGSLPAFDGSGPTRSCEFSMMVGPRNLLLSIAEDDAGPGIPERGALQVLPSVADAPPEGLAVAEVQHSLIDTGEVLTILRDWRAELGLDDAVAVAPGFHLAPAGHAASLSARWRFEPDSLAALAPWDPEAIGHPPATALGAARRSGPPVAQPCVALIDTGSEIADEQILFQQTLVQPEDPTDESGHGTGIASVIRYLTPQAWVWALRVIRSDEALARSSDVLNAIIHVRNRGQWHEHPADVICLALASAEDLAATELYSQHVTLEMALSSQIEHQVSSPVVVCAAGNDPTREMGFPATLTGATVALATDISGLASPENSRLPDAFAGWAVLALGGSAKQPVGWLADNADGGRPAKPLHGSSFAAAVVVAALAGQAMDPLPDGHIRW